MSNTGDNDGQVTCYWSGVLTMPERPGSFELLYDAREMSSR
jgi:hypothetical protein